jgi:hypothetical protein
MNLDEALHMWKQRGYMFNEREELAFRIGFETGIDNPKQLVVTNSAAEPKSFELVWASMQARGYNYGEDALEQVRLGFELYWLHNHEYWYQQGTEYARKLMRLQLGLSVPGDGK